MCPRIHRTDFHQIFTIWWIVLLIVDYRSDLISDRSKEAMAPNFRYKMGEIGRLTFIRRIGIPKRNRISQF